MSETRGGPKKRKRFSWQYDSLSEEVYIKNQDGKIHRYSVIEIINILLALKESFNEGFFPLANNVEI